MSVSCLVRFAKMLNMHPYSLGPWKIRALCQTNMAPKHYITNNKSELQRLVRLTVFKNQNCNLFQFSSSSSHPCLLSSRAIKKYLSSTEASRDILKFWVSEIAFPEVFRRWTPCCLVRIHARLGTMPSKCPNHSTTSHSSNVSQI